MNLLCAILLGITVVGEVILFAWMLLDPDMRPDRMLTLRLTAIMLPYVLLICGTAFLERHPPGPPPVRAAGLRAGAAERLPHRRRLHRREPAGPARPQTPTRARTWPASRRRSPTGWRSSSSWPACLQGLILLPALQASGFRFQPGAALLDADGPQDAQADRPRRPGGRRAATVGAAGQGHLHRPDAGRRFRRPCRRSLQLLRPRRPLSDGNGRPARLNLAQFLYQFPLGVFAIALATAIFPGLSSDALDKDRDRFRSVLRGGIEATLWEGIPASLGLILVRDPAIRLLFQHGQITAHDADLIGQSVLYYSGAIWAFSLLQIVNRAYYAIHDTVTPLVMSVVNIVLNLVVEIPLLWWLGEAGMAVGTLVSFAIQAVVMLWMLDRKIGGLGLRQSVVPVLKMIAAAAVMGAACWAVQKLPGYPHGNNRLTWLVQLVVLIVVGAGVYIGGLHADGPGGDGAVAAGETPEP